MTRLSRPVVFASVFAAVVAVALIVATHRRERPTQVVQTPGAAPKPSSEAKPKRLPRIPPPMFSREYVDSLHGLIEMEAGEAQARG